jgi:hypothetical protein
MHLSNVVFLVFNKVVVSWWSYDRSVGVGSSLPCTTDTPQHNYVAFIDREGYPGYDRLTITLGVTEIFDFQKCRHLDKMKGREQSLTPFRPNLRANMGHVTGEGIRD